MLGWINGIVEKAEVEKYQFNMDGQYSNIPTERFNSFRKYNYRKSNLLGVATISIEK